MLGEAQRSLLIPQGPVEFDPEWIDPRKVGFAIIPGAFFSRDPVRRIDVGTFPLGVSNQGRGYRPTADTGRSQIASSANDVFDSTSCTMLLVTTLISINSGTAMNGYINGGNRVDVNLPFTDNKIYWSFGNSTTGVGRVATANAVLFADGKTHTYALVAGSRGREIWMDGVRIANDTGATSTRNSDASPVYIGSASATSSPIHVQHMWVSLKEQWPLDKLARWGANPGVGFLSQRRTMVTVLAGGGGDQTITINDTAAGADALNIAVALGLSDTGAGSDGLAGSAAVPIADTGAGTDGIGVTVTFILADTGAGTDGLSVLSETLIQIAESGAGSDAVSITASVNAAETGAGTDGLALSVSLSISDSGAGSDALSVLQATLITIAETAAGTDGIGAITVAITLPETATGVDAVAIAALVSVLETASGMDVAVVQNPDAARIVTIVFTPKTRAVEFAMRTRSITFTLN